MSKVTSSMSEQANMTLCIYLSLHADIYKKKTAILLYIYVKTCIHRAMGTGLKMQYPEAVKENG